MDFATREATQWVTDALQLIQDIAQRDLGAGAVLLEGKAKIGHWLKQASRKEKLAFALGIVSQVMTGTKDEVSPSPAS